LQDFIGRGGIAGNAAEIAMKRAGCARVEGLKLGLRRALELIRLR
jgi:hypothetical protein